MKRKIKLEDYQNYIFQLISSRSYFNREREREGEFSFKTYKDI